jgi:site-specific recombinase XerC
MSAFSIVASGADLPESSDLSTDALDYGRAALSSNTMRAYKGDWLEFSTWCDQRQRPYLPASPATVANFASSLASAGKKVPTIARKLAAIRFFHRGAGEDNPTDNAGVAAILKGIRRTVGTAPQQKAPATVDVIHALIARIAPDTLQGKRDRAILLLGFAGAFRRSELVAITVDDLKFSEKGVDVFLPKSKTDQEGRGQSVAVLNGKALKPADRLREWLDAAGIASGPDLPPHQPWRPSYGRSTHGSVGGFDCQKVCGRGRPRRRAALRPLPSRRVRDIGGREPRFDQPDHGGNKTPRSPHGRNLRASSRSV